MNVPGQGRPAGQPSGSGLGAKNYGWRPRTSSMPTCPSTPLRYYERAGLLPAVARDGGGRRRYSDQDLGWIGLIRCLRETGMGIADIGRLVELTQAGPGTSLDRVSLLEAPRPPHRRAHPAAAPRPAVPA